MKGVKAVVLLLFVSLAFSGVDYWNGKEKNGVDYWGTEKSVKDEKKLKELERVYRESLKWFPENVSPIEKYFYEHPNDKEVWKYLYRYYEQRTERANKLAGAVLYMQSLEELKLKEVLDKVEVIYFYSPNCPYCRATEPLISFLSEKTRVYRVDITNPKNVRYVYEFSVMGTPTIVFVKKGTLEEVGRWVGIGTWDRKFKNFVLSLKGKL